MKKSPHTPSVDWSASPSKIGSFHRMFAILGLALAVPAATWAQTGCATATTGGSWVNTGFAAQTGTFTATFDATPTASPTNAVVALSNGGQTAYTNFACLVRFNTAGDIDARNGAAYAGPATPIPYAAGVSYHFRLAVNIAAQTYSIYVTPAGGSELNVGTNFAFRIAAATLNNWGIFVDAAASGGAGSVTTCNFTTAQTAAPTFSPTPGTYTSAQSISMVSTTGGAAIRYTTNGSTPSETAGTLYSGPVSISATTTLKAIAYASGFSDSTVTSGTYTINSTSGGGTLTGTSSDGFHSLALSSAQTGTFTATCDATPSASPENAIIGLSNGAATAYTSISCLARFNPSGNIDAYNGTGYAAAATIPYSAGLSYHFRMVVNVPANTYSIYVTAPGGSEQTVGLNYAFRVAQTSLDNWNLDVNATPAGCSLTARNLSGTSASTLDPTVAPGGNFDLSRWTEQIPVLDSNGNITQISPSQLEGPNGFQDQYFYTNTTTGAMEFWVPENGAHTTNSSFPRSELRETQPGGDWFLPGTHTMTATLVVNDTVGTVTIGQIHLGTHGTPSSTKPLLELQCTTGGTISLFLETSPSGSGGSHTITTVPLGTKFSYMIKLVGNTITIMANGVTQTFPMDTSYNSEDFYFKAGAYLQTTGSNSSVGSHVSFYALNVTHQ